MRRKSTLLVGVLSLAFLVSACQLEVDQQMVVEEDVVHLNAKIVAQVPDSAMFPDEDMGELDGELEEGTHPRAGTWTSQWAR